jgi:hypothetical protein
VDRWKFCQTGTKDNCKYEDKNNINQLLQLGAVIITAIVSVVSITSYLSYFGFNVHHPVTLLRPSPSAPSPSPTHIDVKIIRLYVYFILFHEINFKFEKNKKN